MRRASLLSIPLAAVLLALATIYGRAEGAVATPGENETTYTRLRMIAVHRDGFETLIVQPELEIPGAAAREVTLDEALAAPSEAAAEKIATAQKNREESRRAKLKGLKGAEARALAKIWADEARAREEAGGITEFSKNYAARFKGAVGLCNWMYGDRPGKVSVFRLQEAMEAVVWGEGLTDHAVTCVQLSTQLGSYESVLDNPEDIAFTFSVTPAPEARPARLAWVIPVPSEPLAFSKAPAKIFDEVDHATEELLPAAPPADVVAGLPPQRMETVSGGAIEVVPGQGTQAIGNLKRLLSDGQFGSLRDVDLEKHRGDWRFLLYKTATPVPMRASLEPVAITFRAEKLTLPGRIYGGGGVKQAQAWIFSDRIIPPAALRQYGFTFQGKTSEDGRQDGVDYQAKHVPASLASILQANARVAPPLAALAKAGAVYRFDGFPLAVQPGVWSAECEIAFATFSSPRKLPDSVHAEEDEAAKVDEGGCGCRTAGPGASAAWTVIAIVGLTRGIRKRTPGR